MSRTHALLSPSGGERWMACTPSARLNEGVHNNSAYADEGTLAHDLAETLLKDKLGLISASQFAKSLTEIQRNSYYNKAMFTHCSDYADIVCEKFNNYKAQGFSPEILIETRVDYSFYAPEGSGYLDCAIYTSRHVNVIDFKYGTGVTVKADNNTQLKLYAVGVLEKLAFTHDIKEIYLSVYQPRAAGLSDWMLTAGELITWATDVVKPAALAAWNGEGDFVTGSHCRFCGIKAQCRAFAEKNLETARDAFKDPVLLEDTEITELLGRFDMFTSWMKSVQQYALSSALAGKRWPGYKLVSGKSNRKYKDESLILNKLLASHFAKSQITETKLLTITEMEAFLGKSLFKKMLGKLVIKPKGQPTLVTVEDERPEYNAASEAAKVFADADVIEDFG